jgi:hypothetical protein
VAKQARAGYRAAIDSSCKRLGPNKSIVVGRQADAIRSVEPIEHLTYVSAIGSSVEDSAEIARMVPELSQISEPEATLMVEYKVIWSEKWVACAGGIKILDHASIKIDTLDPTTMPVRKPAPIVADVDRAVRTDCCSVRHKATFGDYLYAAVCDA